MTHSLPLFHRLAGQPVIVLGEGEPAEAKRRLVERAGGVIVGESDSHARLAFVAMAEPDQAAAKLKARGLLVNVTDRPDLCDFTVPSLLERGPVLVAIGTGGASAGLAKSLRLRLEAVIPASLGALADGLAKARTVLRGRFPDSGSRRRALDRAMASGGALDPLSEGSAERIVAWLENAESTEPSNFEIRLRSCDPDDLTLREARLLGTADLIAYERAVPETILMRARADAARRLLADGEILASAEGVSVTLRAPA